MAASPPPPPPPPAPTTITELGDDLLREIFVRLPDVTTLARAAFACHTFLRAVRSSRTFRRRFRELRAPPLLALFQTDIRAIVPAAAGKGSHIAAAFDGLLQDSDASQWRIDPDFSYRDGYAHFVNKATDQSARYSPHSQALNIYPKNLRHDDVNDDAFLEFHTLSPDADEQRPSRAVCVHRDGAWAWARVAVFSSQTMEWEVVLPEMDTGGLLDDLDRYTTGTVVNGFVCWVHKCEGCILALNTVTFHFSKMDLPPLLKVPSSRFQLGHTKDGKFCVVNILQCTLSVWLWEADDHGLERFVLHKTFSLLESVSEVTERSEDADVRMRPMALINGFVYLCIADFKDKSPSRFLSFCLETTKVNLLHKHKQNKLIFCSVDPYIMVTWPSSLIRGKEDSETGVAGNMSEDDDHMGTEEASPVLFTALQSFKEKLIDNGNSNFAAIDSFVLDGERNSLLRRIATLESGLAAARDCVLRIGTKPKSMSGMELVTLKSKLAAARGRIYRKVLNAIAWKGWRE